MSWFNRQQQMSGVLKSETDRHAEAVAKTEVATTAKWDMGAFREALQAAIAAGTPPMAPVAKAAEVPRVASPDHAHDADIDLYNQVLCTSETPAQRHAREAAVSFSDGLSSLEYGGSG